jgi:hypothetical protein
MEWLECQDLLANLENLVQLVPKEVMEYQELQVQKVLRV